jgi:DNA-directed RNA polymerase subunit RPC12/RpoP
MGIRFICPNCGKKLNVKSHLAGKRGICPDCETRIHIPSEPSTVSAVDEQASKSYQVAEQAEDKPRVPITIKRCLSEKPDLNWYIRPAGGDEYGPADNNLLLAWVNEHRIGADTELRRDDWLKWKPASDILIDYAGSSAVGASSAIGETTNITNQDGPTSYEEDVDLGDEEFLAALEYQAEDTNGDFTFANLEIDQSTMAQRNLQSQESSKNRRITGIALGILSVIILVSLVVSVILSQS